MNVAVNVKWLKRAHQSECNTGAVGEGGAGGWVTGAGWLFFIRTRMAYITTPFVQELL